MTDKGGSNLREMGLKLSLIAGEFKLSKVELPGFYCHILGETINENY